MANGVTEWELGDEFEEEEKSTAPKTRPYQGRTLPVDRPTPHAFRQSKAG